MKVFDARASSALRSAAEPGISPAVPRGLSDAGSVLRYRVVCDRYANDGRTGRTGAQAGSRWIAALWMRDVPLRDPTFGEVGQIFDPWVWRGHVTAHTSTIALATGAIVLPIIEAGG
jgi:hypothetical protein